MKVRILFNALLFASICLINVQTYSQSAVESYGHLSVSGNQIVNEKGVPVQLRGMSLFWSQWIDKYWNSNTVDFIADDWCANVVRCAMAAEATDGYIDFGYKEEKKVRTVVDAAIAKGIYVIIDFHSHEAENYTEEAVAFFEAMATTYGEYPNVIYEIYNEPLNVSWSNVIKPYAETVIDAIRKIDPDNLIIVGTPKWSQDVDVASNNPINRTNIAYTLHYYAASHGNWLRQKAQTALNNGIPLFVTEYGVCEASGDGLIDEWQANEWWDFLDQNNISHCNWSLSDKDESASALKPNTSINGGWTAEDYTESGTLVRNEIKSHCPDYSSGVIRFNIPSKIEAEYFHESIGVETEPTEDIGGGENVGYFTADDYISFDVSISSTGYYNIDFRIAAETSGGQFNLLLDDNVLTTITIPSTGDFQVWETVTSEIQLETGQHTLKIQALSSGWNINYFETHFLGESPIAIPGLIEAEDFSSLSGMQLEETDDIGGGYNVGWVDEGDWIQYYVNVEESGSYLVDYRLASDRSTGAFDMFMDDEKIHDMTLSTTGGWQEWITQSVTVDLTAGKHILKLVATGDSWNINYIEFSPSLGLNENKSKAVLNLFPNPVSDQLNIELNSDFTTGQKFTLTDQVGRIVMEGTFLNPASTLQVNDLENGLYILSTGNSINRIRIQHP